MRGLERAALFGLTVVVHFVVVPAVMCYAAVRGWILKVRGDGTQSRL